MKKLLVLAFVMSMTIAVTAQITWNAKLGGGFAMCVSDNKKDDQNYVLKIVDENAAWSD